MGDNLATNKNSSVQPKEPVIEAIFEFREIVLGYPFFSGCIDQKYNLRFTNEVPYILEVMIDGPSGFFYRDKIFRIVFGPLIIVNVK